MSMDLSRIVDQPASGRRTPLILDHLRYTQALLLRGASVPWEDVAGFVSFFGQAQGLLKPDAALVDLGALYGAAVERRPELRAAMTARSRTGYALKTLLADESLAADSVALASAVAHTSRVPLVLQVPAPLTWLARLERQVGAGDPDGIDQDDAENMAIYLADWLRRLSSLPVAVLLLDARRADLAGLVADSLAESTPVANTAEHYRWTLGMRFDDRVETGGGEYAGAVLPARYWSGADVAVPEGSFLLSEIPATASPEVVLARLAELG